VSELKHVYCLKALLTKAWVLARAAARRFGGTARAYIAASLRQCWAEAKALAAEIAAQRARVLAEVERVRFEFSAFGLARQRRADAQLEAELQAHRREMRARAIAYRQRWGSVPADAAPARRAA
jgi:hypothetical protein